jgi:hypothetical protein
VPANKALQLPANSAFQWGFGSIGINLGYLSDLRRPCWPQLSALSVRRREMLIVLLDEPGLFVFSSPADAAREIEPIDAESEIRAAFDDSAVPYTVEWVRPNRHRKALFGLLNSIKPGEDRLVPAGPAQPAALIELLEAHRQDTNSPEAKADLDVLLSRLRAAERRVRWAARRSP